MAGKAKFDQEAAFKSIVGAYCQAAPESEDAGQPAAAGAKNKNRVQRSYFIDHDLDKALRRMTLEADKNLMESINKVLRKGLSDYL